jgi:hypothetical protein
MLTKYIKLMDKIVSTEDGVQQIYPDAKDGTKVFMKDNPDKEIFNVSYGSKSHIPFTKHKQGTLTFFNTEGSKIEYHSGQKSGRSTRIDTYPDGGMWKNKTKYLWKDNPGYLYTEKGIKNGEYTTFIRVHDDLHTHQAYAHKIGGRDEDALRSLIEMVYPTTSHSSVTVNYNYAHFPYVSAKPKLFANVPLLKEDKWLGLKTIHIINDNFTHWEMWADTDPIAEDGTINNNWKKIAEYKDVGCDGYNNVPLKWRCHKDVCRVDGFGNVDFALFSDREIDPNGHPSNQSSGAGSQIPDPRTNPAPIGDGQQGQPRQNNDFDWNSVEEVAEAEDFIRNHPDIGLLDLLDRTHKQQ